MSMSIIPVKSKSPYGIRMTTIPDTHSAEYRLNQKKQWEARLLSEIEEYHVRRGYSVGFVTLTYQEKCLPTIPRSFFKEGEYRRIPCFSYEDVKQFIDTLRNYFFRRRRWRNAFRFLLTCEYGEQFKRPHYHALLLYSSRISPEEMYKLVEDAWCGSSQIIPQPRRKALRRKPLGIVAPFSSFVSRDPQACGCYVAKYVCKDLAFEAETAGMFDHLSRAARNHLRHFKPFHKQSMAFGADLIKDKTDDELWDLLRDGFQITGNPQMVELPVYLKNKILFNNRKIYNLRTHRWETRKFYTKFLMENRDRVAAIKFRQSKNLFARLCTDEYWKTHPVKAELKDEHLTPDRMAATVRHFVDYVGLDHVAWFHSMYFGIPAENCYEMQSDGDWFVTRYDPIADCTEFPKVDPEWHRVMTDICTYAFSQTSMTVVESRSAEDELTSQVRAFFNNQMR